MAKNLCTNAGTGNETALQTGWQSAEQALPALHHLFFEGAKLPTVRQPASVFPETGSEFLALEREKLTLF